MIRLIVGFILNILCLAECYKILVIFPTPIFSHYRLGEALGSGLAEAGHDVTMVSAFQIENLPNNGSYREIVLTGSSKDRENILTRNLFARGNMNKFSAMAKLNSLGHKTTEEALKQSKFQKLIHSGEKFDVVVIEQFLNDGLKALAAHFNAHLVILSTIIPNLWRTWNLVIKTAAYVNQHLLFYPMQQKIVEELIPNRFDFESTLYNVSLVLCNSHESVNQPVPMVPNMVHIGGYHIKPPKDLPRDLGSSIKPSAMDEDKKNAILRALGKLNQKVLWKWDEDTIPDKPTNIKLAKWLPQQDLLAHPNVRLFVTHGGLLSTLETIYHGVPVLALPIFADQKLNAARAQEAGYGKYILFSEMTEKKLEGALKILLNEPKYKENAKRRSAVFHDRPIKPMDLAIYWIEYVIRHKGAEHLRVAGAKLPWYQYFSLDCIALIILVTLSPLLPIKLLFLSNLLCFAHCYSILLVFPTCYRSHHLLGDALAKGLAEAGHDVTIVSMFKTKDPLKNGRMREVLLTEFTEDDEGEYLSLVVLLIALILHVLCFVQCYKILVVFPMAAPSHYILGEAIARGLLEAGHDVTMVTSFAMKNPPKNGKYRDVLMTGFAEEHKNQVTMNLFQMGHMSVLTHMVAMNFIGNDYTRKTLGHPAMQKLIQSGEKFDAMVIEQFVDGFVGNPSPPSYIPDWSVDYPIEMNLFQRTWNFIIKTAMHVNNQLVFYPGQKKIAEEFIPKGYDYYSALYNVSLVLCNSHESTNQAVPMVSNMVHVGGFHIKPPKKLPQEFQEFMDSAKEGVIYFSLGSNIKPSMMGEDKKMAILKSLGKLKQKVLWKWDEDTIPGKPANVKLAKWFPQQDLLAHPNMKLFVTHGGLLSTLETIYHGVPVLSLPIFADQKMNAARAQEAGYGLYMFFSEITEQKLDEALERLLNDPKPIKPMQLAIYWIEYVIRHKGAEHLRVAGAKLPWYQYYSVDSIGILTLVALSPIILLKFLLSLFRGKAKVKKE
nr:unnamed protein product [Callosobruchus analis]